ncbi:MAG: S8 family serine peptidase [Phycisphaerales bacterium JB039]
MMSTRSVAIVGAAALALAAGTAASAGEVTWAGTVVRSTGADVQDYRAVPIEGSSAVIMTWQEVQPDGSLAPFYAISLDGRAVDTVRQADYRIRLRYADFDPARVAPAIPAAASAPAGHDAWIVQFQTQFLEPYRAALEARGVKLEQFLNNHSYIVRMDDAARAAVQDLPFVRWVGPFHPAYKLDEPLLLEVIGAAGDSPAPVRRYSIMMLDRGANYQDAVARRIGALGGVVTGFEPEGYRIEAFLDTESLGRVAAMSEVQFIDIKGEPEEDLDIVRATSGADFVHIQGYTGKGVRAEVCDGGLRTTHVDWQFPPIIHTANSTSTSHGTSVYGHVFGDGTGNPLYRGMIPDAQGIFAAYSSVGLLGGTATRYGHTAELVDETGPYRAVFQTNSWGDPRTSDYTTISAQIDDIQFLNDFNIFQSQSNSGSTPSRPQAWGKNTTSVGALTHRNTFDKSDDFHGGSASTGGSTGPASDGRIKPDLMFFYDLTRGPSSGSDTSYSEFSGTSGATPCVAGNSGIMFQMWGEGLFGNDVDPTKDIFDNRPHAATAKAMMINTAVSYDMRTDPDKRRVRQGWGIPSVLNLYNNRDAFFVIDESDVLAPLQTATYELTVADGRPDLRVTMAYLEPKGAVPSSVHRINDLDLKVTSPTGTVYWGNNGLMDSIWSAPGGSANTLDNVENVFIEKPAAGVWTVEVIASEVNEDQHVETPALDVDFALVVQGVDSSSCDADCDGDGVLDFFDFLCFQNAFAIKDPYADCNSDQLYDFFDFLCYQNLFAAGCP